MKAFKRFICGLGTLSLTASMLAGCGTQTATPEQQAAAAEAAAQQQALIEVNQNDYRGAVMRVESIKKAVMGVVDGFNERNNAIVSEQPSDFWNSDSYKYLGMNLLNYDVWFETSFFNETETTWDEAVDYTLAQFMNADQTAYTVQNLSVERIEANSYKLTYMEPNIKVPFYKNGEQGYSFTTIYEVTYDANHDWAKCTRWRVGGNHRICDGLFEYARISDTEFVIQTETERMYVRYADGLYDYSNNGDVTVINGDAVSGDEAISEAAGSETAGEPSGDTAAADTTVPVLHDPLAEKPIAEFYYTQLNGEPRYEYAEVVIPEESAPFFSFFDENSDVVRMGFTNVDENDKWVCVYDTENDSIFNNMSELGKDWVFADNGRFKLSLAYYDEMLVVKNENALINMLECTNFLVDGTTESFQEEIYVPAIILNKSDEEIVAALNESNAEMIPELMELSTNGFNFGERVSFENVIENRSFTMVNYDGKSYDIMDDRLKERDSLDRDILKSYVLLDSEYYIDNPYALPQGRMYFVSAVDTDLEGNKVSDNNNYYTMLYEYDIQDDYTIKYNSYYLVSDNPDSLMMLQNIKPRSTTRERVEAAYGEARKIDNIEILDDEGFVQYTVTFPDEWVAYRCENGIIYVLYDANNVVQMVGAYSFAEPQAIDTIYTEPEEE